MEVICLEDLALHQLVETILDRINTNQSSEQPRWLTSGKCMTLLGIKSKTTLQKLRDQGKIRFTQPQHKIILYDRLSILKYLEDHAQDIF